MTELTSGIFNSAKQVYSNNKGSILRTIVYTIGHFVIAITVLMLIADVPFMIALTDAIVEPLANLANKLNIENKMDDQEADGIISGQTLTLSEAENSVDDTKIVTREDTEITETLDSSNIITKMSHNNGKSN